MSQKPDDFIETLRGSLAGQTGPRFWRSLEQLADSPEARRFMEAEFPDLARPNMIDRRTLLQLMAASLSLGGLAACNQSSRKPLLSRPVNPAGRVEGEPIVFATTLERGGYGRGALVVTRDGRPTKVEGNPLHPGSLGASDVWMQADVLSLYDPDRSLSPREFGLERSWADVITAVRPQRNRLVATRGRGFRILCEPTTSPTLRRTMRALLETYPEARWHQYSPLADDNARAGAIMAFGRPVEIVHRTAEADAILCLGGDLFLEEPGSIAHAAGYVARRREAIEQGRGPARLFVAEARPSLVGAKADSRIVLHPSEFEPFARAVLAALDGVLPGEGAHPAVADVARALAAAGPRGLATAGREQPPVVHALAHALNARIGAVGTSLHYIEPLAPTDEGAMESLVHLAQAMAKGEVEQLLILGGNPVYDAPPELDLPNLIRRVPQSAHLGFTPDETSAVCRWHIPARHGLEAWGDLRAFDGTVGLRQPVTETRGTFITAEETLGLMLGQALDGRDLVLGTWRERLGENVDEAWAALLERGVVAGTAAAPIQAPLRPDWDAGPPAGPRSQEWAAILVPDPSVWDGSYANNAWLQEAPRPLTKLVWGNAALISPATAAVLGLRNGDVVAIRAGDLGIEAPVWLLPGHAPNTLTLPLGYGRSHAGRIGNGVGFNAFGLRGGDGTTMIVGIEVTRTGERRQLISTQDHHWIDDARVVRTVTPQNLQVEAHEAPLQPTLYPEYPYAGYAWGMAIDMDACIGCNACVVACQAENNIPVVGPEEVARGREMHWLRVDRYYAGDAQEPQTFFQPVPCMHCEKAPCEIVCPVNATVHSSEGLNNMVYNRCIGTRTCSNNCPYKVRRFNWFEYSGGPDRPELAVVNPEVAVRERGVMEKCTYCVQRIRKQRVEARLDGRVVADGEIQTACQQACPTRAIVFGNINDQGALVTQMKASPRNYPMLGDLNTQPRTTYLARVMEGDGLG